MKDESFNEDELELFIPDYSTVDKALLRKLKITLKGGTIAFTGDNLIKYRKPKQEKEIVKFKLNLGKLEKLTYSIYPILYRLSKEGVLDVFDKKNGLIQTCTYTIEDSQSAIDTYKKISAAEFKDIRYLALYGLLQALFVQQDALQTLYSACLNSKLDLRTEYPKLIEIRDIRNITTGHPTNRGGEYFIISQPTLKKKGYFLVGHDSKDKKSGKEIEIYPRLLLEQELAVIDIYKRITKGLRSLLKAKGK